MLGEDASSDNQKYAIALSILWLVSLILFICSYKAIKLAIAITKTASSFIGSVKTVVLVPVIILVPMVALFLIYIGGFGYTYSTGTPIWGDKGVASLELDDKTTIDLYFWTFAFLWTFAVLDAISIFVISAAASIWYSN